MIADRPAPIRILDLMEHALPTEAHASHVAVIASLLRLADNATGVCESPIQAIAARARMGDRATRNAIADLARWGLVTVETRRRPGSPIQRPSRITLLVPCALAADNAAADNAAALDAGDSRQIMPRLAADYAELSSPSSLGSTSTPTRVEGEDDAGSDAEAAGQPRPSAAPSAALPNDDMVSLVATLAAVGHDFGVSLSAQLAQGRRLTLGQRAALKRIAAKAASGEAATTARVGLDLDGEWVALRWLEARTRRGLPALEAEMKPVAVIVRKAKALAAKATMGAAQGAWTPSAQKIAAYWIGQYLRSTDRTLVERGYPLALLPSRCGEEYGLPTRRECEAPTPAQRAAVAAAEAPVVFTSAELAANKAAMLAATAAFGGGPGLVSGGTVPVLARRTSV